MPGPNCDAGANGTVVAYAHVLSNGTLDTTHSKNVSASVSGRQRGTTGSAGATSSLGGPTNLSAWAVFN